MDTTPEDTIALLICTGTLVRHADGTTDCTLACRAGALAHDWILECDTAMTGCGCIELVARRAG